MLTSLDQLKFDNRFVQQLPADPLQGGRPRQVENACYSFVNPTPVAQPQLVAYATDVAQMLGLSPAICGSAAFVEVFSGNKPLAGMQPYAMCYGGHQFGHWAGQLGDGRAINLGDVLVGPQQRLTLQLKGAGLTPYSRTADGLAVLRSSIREFLCSEAMYHLGVPTTRALSLMLTGEQAQRDMFYSGDPQLEPTAIVCRVAPSFIRFGNFQLLAARQDKTLLKQLIDHTIINEFPALLSAEQRAQSQPELGHADYIRWFKDVSERTALMVAHWMRVGFVHGVMNTDNMSILGLTIDYGPYGWLENYDPRWTPNTTDGEGKRYGYGNQPSIAQWNLLQLANTIASLIEQTTELEQVLRDFVDVYHQHWLNMLATKIGLPCYTDNDEDLLDRLLAMLPQIETDMTIFFRRLANVAQDQDYSDSQLLAVIADAYYQPETLSTEYQQLIGQWLRDYQVRVRTLNLTDAQRQQQMNQVNPKYVLRNYLAQQAIDLAHRGDFSMVHELLQVMTRPYDEQPEFDRYSAKRPEWARVKAGCSMLSCSS